jgi:hypothetical protein
MSLKCLTPRAVRSWRKASHVGGGAAVMGLVFGALECDRQAAGIDEGVDLDGQAAPRAAHATGSVIFSWVLTRC